MTSTVKSFLSLYSFPHEAPSEFSAILENGIFTIKGKFQLNVCQKNIKREFRTKVKFSNLLNCVSTGKEIPWNWLRHHPFAVRKRHPRGKDGVENYLDQNMAMLIKHLIALLWHLIMTFVGCCLNTFLRLKMKD